MLIFYIIYFNGACMEGKLREYLEKMAHINYNSALIYYGFHYLKAVFTNVVLASLLSATHSPCLLYYSH